MVMVPIFEDFAKNSQKKYQKIFLFLSHIVISDTSVDIFSDFNIWRNYLTSSCSFLILRCKLHSHVTNLKKRLPVNPIARLKWFFIIFWPNMMENRFLSSKKWYMYVNVTILSCWRLLLKMALEHLF